MEVGGYIRRKHAPIIKSIITSVQKRSKRTYLKWVKGHNEYLHNKGADQLAKQGAEKEGHDEICTDIEEQYLMTGA